MKFDNKFFHYEVADKKFHNNISAFQYVADLKRKIPWADIRVKFVLDFDFMKNPKKYNWKIEPKESFSYYMEKTAMAIYEKHKNIMLWYSGGTDSHPIAKTFAKLGIPIHLIFCDAFAHCSDNKMTIRKKEWDSILKPTLVDWIKEQNKKNKIIELDEVSVRNFDYNLETFFSDNQFVGNYDLVACDGAWNFPNSKILINENRNNINLDKCAISGFEKPWIVLSNDGWWCHTVKDRVVAQTALRSPFSSLDDDNYFWFYINDFVPELQIKSTWNRISAIEKIIEKYNLPLTSDQVNNMQETTSKYYKEMNDMTGYIPLVESLSLPGYKQHYNKNLPTTVGAIAARFDLRNPYNIELTGEFGKKERLIINDFWKNNILKSTDASFFVDIDNKTCQILYTDLIKVKKLYK